MHKQREGDAPGARKVSVRKPRGTVGALATNLGEKLSRLEESHDALSALVLIYMKRLQALEEQLGVVTK